MRINTRLTLAALVPLIVALVVGLALVHSYRTAEAARANGNIVRQIRTAVTDLNHLVFSYVLYHEERPKQQFSVEYDSLTKLITNTRLRDPEQQRLLEDIRLNSRSMQDLFVKLVSIENTGATGNDKAIRDVEAGLAGQLLTRSYRVDSGAALLRRLTDNDSGNAQRRAIGLVFVVLILTTVPLTVLLARTRKNITTSLINLRKGAEVIGSGNLEHRLTMPVKDELGELARSFDNMTEQLQTVTVSKDRLEQEVKERRRAEEELRVTLGSIGDAVISTDAAGSIAFMNAVAEELTGWKLSDALQKPVTEVFHIINEYTHSEVESPVTKVLREGMIIGLANHTLLIRKDGTEVPIDDSGAPIRDGGDEISGVVLVFRDIAERKKAEEQIARDKYLQQLLLDHFPGVVLLLKTTTREVIASNQAGIDVGAVCGSKCFETWGQNQDPCPWCLAEDLWATGEEQHVVLDAGEKVMEAHWVPVADDLYMHYAFDITERKRAEQKLEEHARVIQQALSVSRSFTFDWDMATNQVNRSDSCKKIFGIDSDEICAATSKHFSEHVHPDDRPQFERALLNLTPSADTYTMDFRLVLSDGSIVTLGETAQAFFDAEGTINRVIGVATDISARKRAEEALQEALDSLELQVQERTAELSQAYKTLQHEMEERKKFEEQLRQGQKMEAIGTLAGGIAHDFNNILAAIIGFTEMTIDDVPDRPEIERNLHNVLKSAMRARDLVKQILAFSRKTNYERTPLSLTPLMKETVQLLRASIPATIEIRLTNTASSDMVLASPVELQQIFMNLATNASLAMQERGGTLEISLSDLDFGPDAPVLGTDVLPGEYLQLIMKDTGVGMSPDVMKRVFEPFFTTREVGKGTGMGLAVVYGIVKDLRGTITVESEIGVGSAFRVLLPKAKTELKEEQLKAVHIPGGKERILFVDDEEMLIEWGQAILERLGYTVATVTNSMEAMKIFSSNPSGFDLVITDHTMPGLTGVQLAKALLKIQSDIPIILCTGHSETVSPEIAKEAGIREYLMKPLVRQELAQAVRRVLDANKEE